MGQSSSQVAPSQVADSMQQPPSSNAPIAPPPKPKRKRERESIGSDDVAHNVKKSKHEAQRSQKERKANRAVPQHRRGTAIKPREQESAEESPAIVEPVEDNITVATPKVNADESPAVADIVDDTIEVASPKNTKNKNKKKRGEQQLKDGIVVNGMGPPGPPKKTRKQDKTKDSSTDVHPTVQIPTRTSEQRVVHVEAGNVADNVDATGGAEIPEIIDGVTVSPVGQPGPTRKDKKERREKKERKRQLAAQQSERADASVNIASQPAPVHSDGASLSAAGNTAPKRENQKKNQTALDSQPNDQDASVRQQDARAPSLTPSVSSELPSAIHLPTPSEGEGDVAVPHKDVNEQEDENDQDYDATHGSGYVQPTEQIQEWLDSQLDLEADPVETKAKKKPKKPKKGNMQESAELRKPFEHEEPKASELPQLPKQPQLPEQPELPYTSPEPKGPESPAQSKLPAQPTEPPAPKLSKIRKKNLTPDSQDVAGRGLVNKGAMAEDADTRPIAMRQFSTAERGTVTGKWTQEELDLADKEFHDFCKYNRVSEADLRLKTTDWANLGPFKTKLYEAFPDRKIEVIRKHMQRRFSPYEKGAWDEEATQRLKDAYAKYPEQWPQISKEVERDVQACRDHWKNQVMYEYSMDRGAWSIAEETKLVNIVEEAVAGIIKGTTDSEIRNERLKAESAINWSEVAKKMEGARSRKQCAEKYRLLKLRSSRPATQPNIAPAVNITKTKPERLSTKAYAIQRFYSKMTPGDIYACLFELVHTLNQMDPSGYHDESTFWSLFSQKRPKDHVYLYTPLVRRTFQGALGTYDSRRLRKADTYPKKLQTILMKMQKLAKSGELDLDEKFYGPDNKAEVVSKRKRRVKKELAEDLVQSSDDEEDATADAKQVLDAGNENEDNTVVPEAQKEQDGGAEQEDPPDADAESLRSETPAISPQDFIEKCKKAGKRQHRAYLQGYGRI